MRSNIQQISTIPNREVKAKWRVYLPSAGQRWPCGQKHHFALIFAPSPTTGGYFLARKSMKQQIQTISTK